MKNEKSVMCGPEEYRCVEFINVDPDESGVEVYNEDDNLVTIVYGVGVPDIEDEEENQKFDKIIKDYIDIAYQ